MWPPLYCLTIINFLCFLFPITRLNSTNLFGIRVAPFLFIFPARLLLFFCHVRPSVPQILRPSFPCFLTESFHSLHLPFVCYVYVVFLLSHIYIIISCIHILRNKKAPYSVRSKAPGGLYYMRVGKSSAVDASPGVSFLKPVYVTTSAAPAASL